MGNNKIVIIVRGGIAQEVYSLDQNVEVVIYDFDEDSDDNPSEEELKKEIEKLTPIRKVVKWHSEN